MVTSSAGALDKALSEAIDELVLSAMQEARLPGVALAIAGGADLAKIGTYGLANVELNVPVVPETLFQIGSMGKPLIATAVMRLVGEGTLRLDDPVARYIPNAPEAWAQITIRRLLSHTSGIGDAYAIYDLRRDYTEDELLDIAFSAPLRFRAGDQWEYANTGYLVLGILVGKVVGKHYADVLEERIFEPLGMQTGQLIDQDKIVPNRAAGYRLDGETLKNQEWVSRTFNSTADGSHCASILDMARWICALQAGTAVSAESLRRMWTRATLNDGTPVDYGFGWELKDIDGRRVAQHGGQWQGFTSHMACYLDDKVSVVVLSNLAYASISSIAHQVAGLCI
ncbi:MAG TPA: serine hydrolase domain-containing protein [Capsulimonadaceae bacterium]|nr:serine hydrolase domain-containing protein [Capsulimonadaceae bacterium]